MSKNVIVLGLVGAVLAGAGFFAGMKYQQNRGFSQLRAGFNDRQQTGRMIGNPANGNRPGFRPVAGEITASDDKSVTVRAVDGSSRIIIISESTVINQAAQAVKSDLKIGEKVSVFGQENPDGSVTAQSIQLNPVRL